MVDKQKRTRTEKAEAKRKYRKETKAFLKATKNCRDKCLIVADFLRECEAQGIEVTEQDMINAFNTIRPGILLA